MAPVGGPPNLIGLDQVKETQANKKSKKAPLKKQVAGSTKAKKEKAKAQDDAGTRPEPEPEPEPKEEAFRKTQLHCAPARK